MNKKFSKQQAALFVSKNILIVLMLAIVVLMTFVNKNFLTLGNFINILRNISVQGILACGLTTLIISGGLDLSFGSTIGLTTVIIPLVSRTLIAKGMPSGVGVLVAFIICLVAGIIIGSLNAYFVTRFKMPPMIATLAMQYVVYGVAGTLNNGYPIYDYPKWYSIFGKGKVGMLPISVIIALVLCAIFYVLLNHTKFGRTIYAVGGNSEAARLSGINVVRYQFAAYIIMQIIAVMGTVVFSSQMMSGSHSYGKDYALLVMSAVVIGGTSIAGGAGNMLGTLKGLLFLGLVLNAMTIANLGEYVQYIVRGGLIIFAIILNMTQQALQMKVQARETEKLMQQTAETGAK